MPLPRKTIRTALLAAAVASTGMAAFATAPATANHHHASASQQQTPNIVETAVSTGVHKTLVAAVQAAGLAETLSSPGPFTVFAPTDTAFAKLAEGTVATLVKPESKQTLTRILTYHAVAGRVTSSDLVNLINTNGGEYRIQTVAGPVLTARLSGDKIIITDGAGRATAVTTANVDTSNGIIHVTDGVFLPG